MHVNGLMRAVAGLLLCLTAAPSAFAALALMPSPDVIGAHGRRVALVVGTDVYETVPKLANARSDAEAVAKGLERIGFKVTRLLNSEREQLSAGVKSFAEDLSREPYEIAAFYYAGHGALVDGSPLMLPASIRIGSTQEITAGAVPLSNVLDGFRAGGSGVNLVMFDACLNDVFQNQSSGPSVGLATPPASLVSFAALAGTCPMDKTPADPAQGPYAAAFQRALERAGATVRDALDEIEQRVPVATDGAQTPWRIMTGPRDVILRPMPPASPGEPTR